MRWVPDLKGRWRWKCKPGVAAIVLGQLTQKSTIVAALNAITLLVGWKLDPGKVDAIGVVLSLIDTIVLTLVQEGVPTPPAQPPPPSPTDGCPT